MTTLHVGFETSDLSPERGGLYTYASQLLHHLSQLPDSPEITLVDGWGRLTRQTLRAINNGSLPAERFARSRPLPLLHLAPGIWQQRPFSSLAWRIDDYVTRPFWRWTDRTEPLARSMARWRLPHVLSGALDLYHWPFEEVFLPVPNVAHVVTLHDTIVLRHPEWQERWYVSEFTHRLRVVARYATRIIADSDNTRRDVIELLGVSPDRVDVVLLAPRPDFHPPVDLAVYRSVLTHHGLNEGEYILYAGQINARKNIVRLAAAFRQAIERVGRRGRGMRLVLAGKRGVVTEGIERELQTLELQDRLVMLGFVPQDDLVALMHGARAVAYVALYEGFGLPPLEAMACGAAVVASNNSSVNEVVGDAGLLVDPYSVEEIAVALQRVMIDDALRDDLAVRGLARAAQFSWAKTAELTMETYRHAVATRREPQSREE